MTSNANGSGLAAAKDRPVVTRFAPSPTGFLHIGGARTALFNWLFARHHGGKYLLRIEDTDRARSTEAAIGAIFDGLDWLGLGGDDTAVFQFARSDRHAQVAHQLLAAGHAYRCYLSSEELAARRAKAQEERRPFRIASEWRDADPATAPEGRPFVVRIKAPRDGETMLPDLVQGDVTVANAEIDDFVLLRSDGTPTYMLAVVVDDHDMGVTHVIRGDDHLNNAARQQMVYDAMGWAIPVWAHIPLIHGPDGKKLSKRHGATGVEEYQAMGYPAAGMRNYLTRLGWAHGDAEIFTSEEAMGMFDLAGIGRAPARLDFKKLENTCGHHMAMADDAALLHELKAFLAAAALAALTEVQEMRMKDALPFLKKSAKTFPELIEKAAFLMVSRPVVPDEKAAGTLDTVSRGILKSLTPRLQSASWSKDALEPILNEIAAENGIGFGKLAAPLRAAIAGRTVTPSVYDMMLVIGRDETIARLEDASS